VQREFYDYLQCGILAHGFLRLRCDTCKQEVLLAFSCKRRGFCPSCAGRRMAQTAAHLVECVMSWVPTRQWVVSAPPLRTITSTKQSSAALHGTKCSRDTADCLSTPTAQEIEAAAAFETAHPPGDQKRLLTAWRRLQLSPALSTIILQNREQERA
jgi:hypothetical protein